MNLLILADTLGAWDSCAQNLHRLDLVVILCRGKAHEACNYDIVPFRSEELRFDLPLQFVSVRGCVPVMCGHITHKLEECELSQIPNCNRRSIKASVLEKENGNGT